MLYLSVLDFSSNCPVPVDKEQKQKDPFARKIIKQIIKDCGSLGNAQEYIDHITKKVEASNEMSTSDDDSSQSNVDDLKDDGEHHVSVKCEKKYLVM